MRPFTIYASDLNITKAKTFTVTAYNGGPLNLNGWDRAVVLDLSRLTLAHKLKVVLDHDAERRVGHIDRVDNNGRRLVLSGVLSAATTWRDEVLSSYRDGFNWEASIEAEADDYRELERGETAQVNGRTIAGPAYITASTLFGFSFVTRGADRATEVAIAASAKRYARPSTPRPYHPPSNFQCGPGGSAIIYPVIQRF